MSSNPLWLYSHYKQVWLSFVCFFVHFHILSYNCIGSLINCNCSEICQIWIADFFLPPQLQHCLPVYLLLSRAHGQSSGGTQNHEPPSAPHHKLSRPAPPGCPRTLFPWTEGCTQEPFWQGEAAPKPSIQALSLSLKLLQHSDHLFYSWTYHQILSGNTSAEKPSD